MPISYLRYQLHDGYIDHWLAVGPQAIDVRCGEHPDSEVFRQQVIDLHEMDDSGVTALPVERGPLDQGVFAIGDYEAAWSYVRCLEDHLVDFSDVYDRCQYLRGWSYTEVEVATAQPVGFVLSTYGPADVWVNETHVHHHEHFAERLRSVTFDVRLREGRNTILVRAEQVAQGACSHAVALRLVGLSQSNHEGARVRLPTTIVDVERRDLLEGIFEHTHLEQAVYEPMDAITVHWEAGDESWTPINIIVRSPANRIYYRTSLDTRPEEPTSLGQGFQFPLGRLDAVLMPPLGDYAGGNLRITRELPLWGLNSTAYSDALYGEYTDRRVEALRYAARREDDVFAEVAKMAMKWWSHVDVSAIQHSLERVNARRAGSVLDLLALLGMVTRYGDDAEFPEEPEAPLQEAILGYRYWHDEPGDDAMDMTTEYQRLLFHTCEILAGQRYPDRIFSNTGEKGAWHREKGEALALEWMREHASRGFGVWDSDAGFEGMLAALTHLEELAEEQEVWEMAAAMIDKMLYALAVNSFKGVFGGTHGDADTIGVLHGMLEATAGISRLMWGMGAFNHHTAGTVSMAAAENYTFPRLIQAIAVHTLDEIWNRERHAGIRAGQEISKVTYRTPDYMLSSVQDYRPGELGNQEHVWQATMGPAAGVFVNHPICASLDDAHRPGYWRGNGILPRVAQWKDVLIGIYDLPEDDWLGFTHAYFPLHAFDGYVLQDGWAFAQKGSAYIALAASRGLQLLENGLHARQELRSYGHHNVWVCHMGREALDGTFVEFRNAILSLNISFDDLSVELSTLRHETLAFGWEGPLRRNGEKEAITGFPHYLSHYGYAEFPAEHLTITMGEQAMRLDLK